MSDSASRLFPTLDPARFSELLESPSANDDESDVEEDLIEVDDEPVTINPDREDARRWGSFEMSAAIARTIGVCRDFKAQIAAAFDGVDPLFRDEFAQRMEDALLGVGNSLWDRLPLNAKRAEQNRARFSVLKGGQK